MLSISFEYEGKNFLDDARMKGDILPIKGALTIYDLQVEPLVVEVAKEIAEKMKDACGVFPYIRCSRGEEYQSGNNVDVLIQIVSEQNRSAIKTAANIAADLDICCITIVLTDDSLEPQQQQLPFSTPVIKTATNDVRDILLDLLEVFCLPPLDLPIDFADLSLLLGKAKEGYMFRLNAKASIRDDSTICAAVQTACSILVLCPRDTSLLFEDMEKVIESIDAVQPDCLRFWVYRHRASSPMIHLYCFKEEATVT